MMVIMDQLVEGRLAHDQTRARTLAADLCEIWYAGKPQTCLEILYNIFQQLKHDESEKY
jgi:hypothetical protein